MEHSSSAARRVESARLELLHAGNMLAARIPSPPADQTGAHAKYYSIAARILDRSAIHRRKLREYFAATYRIWLNENQEMRLDEASRRELVRFSADYSRLTSAVEAEDADEKNLLTDLLLDMAEGSRWKVGTVREWARVDEHNRFDWTATDQPVDDPLYATCWIEYEGIRIEIPIVRGSQRAVYDPRVLQKLEF